MDWIWNRMQKFILLTIIYLCFSVVMCYDNTTQCSYLEWFWEVIVREEKEYEKNEQNREKNNSISFDGIVTFWFGDSGFRKYGSAGRRKAKVKQEEACHVYR